MEEINIEDFKKIDIRIGKILSADKIESSDKLLKMEVDFGSEKRQIVAGLAEFYLLEQLVGKQFPFVFNLKARKLRGAESRGMILCADDGGKPVLLNLDKEVPPGAVVK